LEFCRICELLARRKLAVPTPKRVRTLQQNPHAFPPETIIPPEWNVELETLAAELGYRTTKAAEIQKRVYEFSCRNCQSLKPPKWSLPIGTRPINPPASRRCCDPEQSLLMVSPSGMVENGRTLIETQKANHELATYDPRRLTGVSVYQEIDREFSIGDRFRRFRRFRAEIDIIVFLLYIAEVWFGQR
jgi:hypothetical protein